MRENTINRCQIGISTIGVSGMQIHSNDITLGLNMDTDGNLGTHPFNFDVNDQEGIAIMGGGKFFVEENTVTDANENNLADFRTVGIRVRDVHTGGDVIRKNFLNNLSHANLANGSNVSPVLTNKGLRYLCNENTHNQFDFLVASYPDYVAQEDLAIDAEQKLSVYNADENQFEEYPTGNTHTSSGFGGLEPEAGQFDHLGLQPITYFFHSTLTNQQLEPGFYDDENVTPIEIGALPQCQPSPIIHGHSVATPKKWTV